jgi:DNA-binding transcriptional regulator PaaX
MEHGQRHDEAELVSLQGRILDAVAGGVVLLGSLSEVADRVGASAEQLREALRELRGVGWIAVQLQPGGRLVVRLERRSQRSPRRIPRERRSHRDAWAL